MTLGRPDDKTAGIAKDNLGQVGDKGETVSLGCPKEFVRRILELLYPTSHLGLNRHVLQSETLRVPSYDASHLQS